MKNVIVISSLVLFIIGFSAQGSEDYSIQFSATIDSKETIEESRVNDIFLTTERSVYCLVKISLDDVNFWWNMNQTTCLIPVENLEFRGILLSQNECERYEIGDVLTGVAISEDNQNNLIFLD